MATDEWKPQHFAMSEYEFDDPKLDKDKTRVRLVVQVDGKTEIDMTSQHSEFEPGVIAFVSRADSRGFAIVKVVPAPNGAISDAGELPPAPEWAALLLDLTR